MPPRRIVNALGIQDIDQQRELMRETTLNEAKRETTLLQKMYLSQEAN